jgi:hypothetical protein
MIYSPDHKFLMIQNLKVGGTSLKLALIDILPDTAYVSDIGSGIRSARLDPITHKTTIEKLSHFKTKLNSIDAEFTRTPHCGLANVLTAFPTHDFNLVTSCVFVRNPFDMVFSMFIMNMQQDYALHKFIEMSDDGQQNLIDIWFKEKQLISTKALYTSFGEIDVTHVFKYENGLANEINTILPSVGLPTIPTVGFTAKKYKPDAVTYKMFFKQRHLDLIRKEWEWEFNMFNYDMNPEGVRE